MKRVTGRQRLFSHGNEHKMKKFWEAIMYKIRREAQQPVLPTGLNPLPPLSEFEVKKTLYRLDTQIPYGMYTVEIDKQAEVGFFEHATNQAIRGQFWLAGRVLVSADHLLPRDVRTALSNACIEVA